MEMTQYRDSIRQAMERYACRHGLENADRMKIRAALIDMDGTLYDSMGYHSIAWQSVMRDLGVDTDRDEYFLYEGMTGKAILNLLLNKYFNRDVTDDEAVELYARKAGYFNKMPEVKPMPGAKQLLAHLTACGVKCVLVTGSGQRSLIERLQRDFPGIFSREKMITSAEVVHGKPDPEPYLKAMALAGVEPHESIVIENAPLGVRSGARSGAFTIGLTTGPIPAETLAAEGADIVLPSMMALAEGARALTDID